MSVEVKKDLGVYIYPYTVESKTAIALSQHTGIPLIKTHGSSYKPKSSDVIINWGGCTDAIKEYNRDVKTVYNTPTGIEGTSSKQRILTTIRGTGCCTPDLVTRTQLVNNWFATGHFAVGHNISHTARDTFFLTPEDKLSCNFYTQYIPKAQEYLVHVWEKDVIFVQQLELSRVDKNGKLVNKKDVNWKIRSHNNGFYWKDSHVYDVNEEILKQALRAVRGIRGIQFGAVHVMFSINDNKATVINFKTKPFLQQEGIKRYAEVFRHIVRKSERS